MTEIAEEQTYLSMLYGRLDELREGAQKRLADTLLHSGGNHQARSERESAIMLYTDQIRTWDAAEHGLCFGRLDLASEESYRIGRIGLFDESVEPLLIDWRAPAARPFYLATAAAPQGVRRRRQIRTRLRSVTRVEDEVLELSEADGRRDSLTSESALMSALNAGRTGRMKDIVETIQGEQDRIIRSQLHGVLVVQGGPGTGKTAVALHRAAYLLYTHRESLSRQGVLILGPNETFLRYISQVLPGLGETSVLLSTLGGLFPGVTARAAESSEVAALKGSLEMVETLKQAIQDRQRVPDDFLEVVLDDTHEGFGYQREAIRLDRDTCVSAREKARRSGQPHNLTRPLFAEEIIAALAQQIAEQMGADPYADDPLGGDDAPGGLLFNDGDVAEIRNELRQDSGVESALDWLWPRLTPQELLTGLYADHEGLLQRSTSDWSPADVPVLDEAAELLGDDDMEAEALAERLRRQQVAYAEGVLSIAAGSTTTDFDIGDEVEMLLGTDLISASELAERHVTNEVLTAAQRAAADRRWTFGHIIVDEAQELSPMAWRLLMRRSPNRSMTIVGDVAQTSELAGADTWAQVFDSYVPGRWRLAELTVNYRTPAEITDLAASMAGVTPPTSVRSTGIPVGQATLSDLDSVIAAEREKLDGGRLAVIVAAQEDVEPDLEQDVVTLTVKQAKGLEFDSVIVVDPDWIVASSPRGRNDLYVAMTRATQRLTLVR